MTQNKNIFKITGSANTIYGSILRAEYCKISIGLKEKDQIIIEPLTSGFPEVFTFTLASDKEVANVIAEKMTK